MEMFTSYGHIKKPKWNHLSFDDFRPGHVPLTDSVYNLNRGGWVLETPNWVPGVHDKAPLMIYMWRQPFWILDEILEKVLLIPNGPMFRNFFLRWILGEVAHCKHTSMPDSQIYMYSKCSCQVYDVIPITLEIYGTFPCNYRWIIHWIYCFAL